MVRKASQNPQEPGAHAPVLRCDVLAHAMNPGKERALRAMLALWRGHAGIVGAALWRRFQETGLVDGLYDAATQARKDLARPRRAILAALAQRHALPVAPEDRRRRLSLPDGFADPFAATKAKLGFSGFQMVRAQVAGTLASFAANRQNDFVRAVWRSSLCEAERHMLFAVNRARAWNRPGTPVTVTRDGQRLTVPARLRAVARSLWRQILKRHRRPAFGRIGMTLDQRAITLAPARAGGPFAFWAKVMLIPGARGADGPKAVWVPLLQNRRFADRKGRRKLTVNLREGHEGTLGFGVVTDVGAACAQERADYAATAEGEIGLDFGLANLFASSAGDLLGRDFLGKLKALDATLTGIARHWQRANPGRKLRHCSRYRAQAERARGVIRTEVGRILNRLVATRRPAGLAVEDLDFRHPDLSSRMNRLLSKCGRACLNRKLAALEQEKGLTVRHVAAPYTSQTCSACGYVAKSNRTSQTRFACGWCGHQSHADVNAARNVGSERFRAFGCASRGGRKRILGALTRQHAERWPLARQRACGHTGTTGSPADPRLANPYFKDWRDAARSTPAA